MNLNTLLEESTVRTPEVDVERALDNVRSRHRTRRRRQMRIAAVAAGFVAAVAIAGALSLARDNADRTDITTAEEPEGSGADPVPGWQGLPDAPIEFRADVAAVATPNEFFIWGGRSGTDEPHADGAAYSFDEQSWRAVPRAPMAARAGAVAVWVGGRVVVWGGNDGTGGPLYDGAAWNPDTGDWEPLAEFIGAVEGQTAVTADGDQAIFVGGTAPPNVFLPTDTYALDATTGEWRPLDPYPYEDVGTVTSRKAFSTEHGVIVVSVGTAGVNVAQLDPNTGEWGGALTSEMPTEGVHARTAAWTGEAVVVATKTQSGLVVWPHNWSAGDILPPSGSQRDFPAVALDDGVVSVGDRWIDTRDLEREAASWQDSSPVPGEATTAAAAAASGRLYVWGWWRCPNNARCVDVSEGTAAVWTPPALGAEDAGEAGVGSESPDPGVVDGPHVARDGESAKDLVERFLADVVGVEAVAMGATDVDRRTTVVQLETSRGEAIDATVIADPRRQLNVLHELHSPGLSFEEAARTVAVPEPGTLTVIGYDGGFTGGGEVMVDRLEVREASTVGPLDLVESSWLRIDLQTTDGRTLYLVQPRG